MILFEDEEVLVLNKPAGIAVQGGTGTRRHIDGILAGMADRFGGERPRLVHRLDRDTSGVLLVAKTRFAAAALAAAQALAIQTQINYTREHEYEADRIGFQRLDAGGFDVNAMATLMDRLQKSNRFADGTAPSYLRSHPITYERIAEAHERQETGRPRGKVLVGIA